MRAIRSPQNSRLARFRSLQRRKAREQEGLFPLEGVRLIEEALEAEWPLGEIFVCPELLTSHRARELLERIQGDPRVYEVSESAFRRTAATKTPQGIAATAVVGSLAPSELTLGEGQCLPAACGISDPGNLGTMIRTAYALGAPGLVVVGESVDLWSPKVVRSAMGALFRLPVAAQASSEEFIRWAKREGAELVAASAEAEADCLTQALPAKTVLMVGGEADGLSPELRRAADLTIAIPMPGGAESLNAAVSAGILLYEHLRQLRT